MKAFWCFVAGLVLMSAATEMPEMEMTYVDDVDAENFDEYMKDAEGLLLLFYAPWCNHCRRFMPVFDIAAGEIKKNTNIKIARINGGEEANEPICDRYNLQSFPTVMYITGDKAVEYKGRRTPESILRFVKLAREPTLVDIADKTAYDAFVAENEYAVFGVFGDVEDEGTAYRDAYFKAAEQLKIDFEMSFAVISDTSLLELPDGVEIKKPGLITISKERLPSTMDLALAKEDTAIPPEFPKPDEIELDAEGRFVNVIRKWINYATLPYVDQLTVVNFRRYIMADLPMLWLIMNPKNMEQQEENAAMLQALRRYAEMHRGEFSCVWINGDLYAGQARSLAVKARMMPTFVLSSDTERYVYKKTGEEGTDADKWYDHIRPWVESAYFRRELESDKKSEDLPTEEENAAAVVKKVVGENYEQIVNDSTKDVFIKYYAPWCGHCKELAPVYTRLAELLKDVPTVYIGELNAPENDLPQGHDVASYPTLRFFPADKKAEAIEFKEHREAGVMLKFIHENAHFKFDLTPEMEEEIKKGEEAVAAKLEAERAAKEAKEAEEAAKQQKEEL